MPKLKTILESLDDLPEAQKEFYVADGSKFALDLDDIDTHPKVISLKTSLERLKTDKRKTSDELNKLKERLAAVPEDFNTDEYNRLKELAAELEKDPTKDPSKKDNAEAVAARKMLEQKISALEKAHAAEVLKLNTKLASKETFISRLLIDEGLTKALVEGGVQPQLLKASKAMLRENVKVIEDGDGDYSAVVDTDIGPVDVSRFVSDWIASDEGKVFVVPAKGADAGGGTKNLGNKSNEKNPWQKDTWNLTEQGRLLRADRVKAEKLAKAAGHVLQAAS